MQFLVFELILVLILKKVSDDGEKLVTKPFHTGEGAGQVGRNQINCTVDAVLVRILMYLLKSGFSIGSSSMEISNAAALSMM